MITTAMNNNLRLQAEMTNKQLKQVAYKAGYKCTGTWKCEACEEEMIAAAQSVGYVDIEPRWGNANCALKFQKTGSAKAACGCGWRKDITINFAKVAKVYCPGIEGKASCHGKARIGEREINRNGGFCTKCRPYDPTTNAMPDKVKTCNRKDCTNPVPSGRKAVCYSCQPPTKEAASSDLIM